MASMAFELAGRRFYLCTVPDDILPTVRPSGPDRVRPAPRRVHPQLEKAGALTLLAENPEERLVDRLELRGPHLPGSINDDSRVRREQSIGAYPAALAEPTTDEVGSVESHGIAILSSLTRDLAKNEIVPLQSHKYQSRTPLGLAEVREREVQDDDIALYKLAQAASSWGESQSSASEDSAASAGMDASACSSVSVWRNSSKRSRSPSDSLFSS